MTNRVIISWWLAAMALFAIVPLSRAQTQSSPAPAPIPQHIPALTRHPINHRDWTIIIDLRLLGSQPQTPPGTINIRPTQRVNLDTATLFFPIPTESATHEAWNDAVTGSIILAGRKVVETPRLLTGYQSFTRLSAWDLRDVDADSLHLHLEVPMTCWETRIDEARAASIAWPVNPWPPDLAACLLPQTFIDSDSPIVQSLVERWIKQAPTPQGTKRLPPYLLAKYLTGRVISHYQPSAGALSTIGRGRNSIRYSGVLLSGFNLDGAAAAAERGRGPLLDMPGLLVAAWRAAGIPSRIVIGYDNRDQDPSRGPTQRSTRVNAVRAWAEFMLYNELTGQGEWVPVDIERQREFASRAPPLDQRWQFFGHNEEMDFMCPLAFHWLPPTPCVNVGPPAMWGWVPQPEGVVVEPDLRISIKAAARRGDDPKRSTPAPGGGGGTTPTK
jgi:hypothetical protein